jgi:hypothetical protein
VETGSQENALHYNVRALVSQNRYPLLRSTRQPYSSREAA